MTKETLQKAVDLKAQADALREMKGKAQERGIYAVAGTYHQLPASIASKTATFIADLIQLEIDRVNEEIESL